MGLSKDELRKMTLEEIIKLTKGDLKKVGDIIEQISSSSSTKSHDESKIQSSDKSSPLTHESSSMDKYFLTPQSNNEIVLNKLSLKKIKAIAKKMGLKNYSQYNSKTKLDLIKLILKEELNAGDWFNKLSRLNIKKLDLKIKQNSKKTDLVNQISDNVNNEANLNTVLNEIGSPKLEETMSKNESTQNTSLTSASHTTIKELRKIDKEKNIKGYSKMKKSELLQKIGRCPHERSEINDQPFAFEDSYFTEFSKKSKIKIIETNAEYTKRWRKHKVYYKVILLKDWQGQSRGHQRFPRESKDSGGKAEDEESSESDLSDIIMKKITAVREVLNEMIKIVKQKTNFKEGDLLNIVVNHNDLWSPISTGLSRTSDIDNLLNKIQSILTSNQDLDIYGCTFYTEVVNMPRGATNAKRILNLAEDSRTKKSITSIKNKDNLCCPRAVIVGLTYHTNIILGKEYDHNDIIYIRKGRNLQTTLAQELCNQLGEYNRNYFTLDDIANIERLLNIQIKIVAAECFNSIIYSGPEKDVKVYLYKNGNHFDTINSMTGFYGQSYYCKKCDKPYQIKDGHKCLKVKKTCLMCFNPKHEEDSKQRIYCEKCNRYCFNQECLENHSEVCERFHKCLKCNKILKRGDKMVDEGKKMIEQGNKMIEEGDNMKGIYIIDEGIDTMTRLAMISKGDKIIKKGNQIIKKGNKMIEEGGKEHKCGWEKCLNCYKEVEILKHKCYMQWKRQKGGFYQTKIKENDEEYTVKGCKNCNEKGCTIIYSKEKVENKNYWVYQCGNCKIVIKKPLNDTKPFKCVKCRSKYHTTKCSYTEKYLFFDYEAMQETGKHIANLVISHDFSGNVNSFKTNEDFCKWLFSRVHKGYTAIAHYSKGYDSYFILKYCVENGIKPFCIYNGSKIMLMEIKSINLRIIDSSNFVQGPLKISLKHLV
ncbi:hypothetical protein TcasGA2_TC001811 [Tribolium castaneum]|uniref:Rho termination factor-like N-terminal domain-containing protein n=1 Tax=Tribolium castaneum TaxID=7070 RepID=D7EKJ0_TRICA|nr:hypothetical protein TcasGA2_TC001811 [Tribolium castaneum]